MECSNAERKTEIYRERKTPESRGGKGRFTTNVRKLSPLSLSRNEERRNQPRDASTAKHSLSVSRMHNRYELSVLKGARENLEGGVEIRRQEGV